MSTSAIVFHAFGNEPLQLSQMDERLELVPLWKSNFTKPSSTLLVVAFADVQVRESLEQDAEAIHDAFGDVHILINAAGGNHPQATTGADESFFDLPDEALRFVFDLNTRGTISPSQAFGRRMAKRWEGLILNVRSMSAFTPLTHIPGYSAPRQA